MSPSVTGEGEADDADPEDPLSPAADQYRAHVPFCASKLNVVAVSGIVIIVLSVAGCGSRSGFSAGVLAKAARAGWRRSLSRQRARVGTMRPTGIPSSALIRAS